MSAQRILCCAGCGALRGGMSGEKSPCAMCRATQVLLMTIGTQAAVIDAYRARVQAASPSPTQAGMRDKKAEMEALFGPEEW